MKKTAQELITILRAAVLGEALPEGFAVRDAGALFRLARMQDLAHLLLVPEGAAVLFSDEERALLEKQRLRAIWRWGVLANEQEKTEALLEREGIRYLPLKGAYVRALWPEPWMRTSSDVDLLVDRSEVVRVCDLLANEAGYTQRGESPYNLSLYSEGEAVHLELHFALSGTAGSAAVLSRVWDYTREEGGVRLAPSTAFLLLHLLSHLAMHLLAGGGGIRPLLDIFLVRRHLPYREEELTALLREAGLLPFGTAVLALSDAWFGGGEENTLTERLGDWLIGGQMYSDLDRRTLLSAAQGAAAPSPGRAFLGRILIPRRDLALSYPRLSGRPYLYPYYSLVRLLSYLFHGRLGLAFRNTRRRRAARATITAGERASTEAFLRELGLM